MDKEGTESNVNEAAEEKKTEDDGEDIDLEEINRIEKILENDASEELKCLDFERQMFIDCAFNDGLMICAK
jgi:hypothetical protein